MARWEFKRSNTRKTVPFGWEFASGSVLRRPFSYVEKALTRSSEIDFAKMIYSTHPELSVEEIVTLTNAAASAHVLA
jgi:hypothetical protein